MLNWRNLLFFSLAGAVVFVVLRSRGAAAADNGASYTVHSTDPPGYLTGDGSIFDTFGDAVIELTSTVSETVENVGFFTMGEARGIRNNNPGNIRDTSETWIGEVGKDNVGYVIFDSAQNGIRALAKLLINYQKKYALKSVRDIIARWAPDFENDTENYIAHVAKQMGVSPTTAINLNDDNTLATLTKLIIKHENGSQPYSDNVIYSAIYAARIA